MKPVKDELVSAAKNGATTKGGSSSKPAAAAVPASSTGPVTEDEIRAVLMHKAPVTTQDLVAKFKSRLRTKEVCFFFF